MTLVFSREFNPAYGRAVPVGPGVDRLTANNPSEFTFFGTNTYIVGAKELAVIDPGPDSDVHLAALLNAIDGRPVSHILLTHSHSDHSSLARRLKLATGTPILGASGSGTTNSNLAREQSSLDFDCDRHFVPDALLDDGEVLKGNGWDLLAVHTPGHAADHLAFSLEGTGILFSGDHVMGWSSTVIAPPDGSMSDYMGSLDKLSARDDRLYLPGHGGTIEQPRQFVGALRDHRRARENAILERLRAGDRKISDVVATLYRDKSPSLRAAAGMTVLAHLEDLVSRGIVRAQGNPSMETSYTVA